jgi:hypothetical protein
LDVWATNITWMSKETNRKIKGYKRPSQYVKQFISDRYGGNEEEFLEVLDTHFINKEGYDNMLKNDLDGFIEERENELIFKIKELIGISEPFQAQTLITPNKPFSNKIAIWQAIESCHEYIYWVDRYFSIEGLRWLMQWVDKRQIKDIKILTSINKADDSLRRTFKDFKNEMLNNHQIRSELRIMTDPKLDSSIHDRWMISKDACFNLPSPDVIARGQYSEIKNTTVNLPFNMWWQNSTDILEDWNQIQELLKQRISRVE